MALAEQSEPTEEPAPRAPATLHRLSEEEVRRALLGWREQTHGDARVGRLMEKAEQIIRTDLARATLAEVPKDLFDATLERCFLDWFGGVKERAHEIEGRAPKRADGNQTDTVALAEMFFLWTTRHIRPDVKTERQFLKEAAKVVGVSVGALRQQRHRVLLVIAATPVVAALFLVVRSSFSPTKESRISRDAAPAGARAPASATWLGRCPPEKTSAPVVVSSVSPSSVAQGVKTTFTIAGLELPATSVAFISHCIGDEGSGAALATARNDIASQATFSCTPMVAGSQTLIVKDAPGCKMLYTGTVDVVGRDVSASDRCVAVTADKEDVYWATSSAIYRYSKARLAKDRHADIGTSTLVLRGEAEIRDLAIATDGRVHWASRRGLESATLAGEDQRLDEGAPCGASRVFAEAGPEFVEWLSRVDPACGGPANIRFGKSSPMTGVCGEGTMAVLRVGSQEKATSCEIGIPATRGDPPFSFRISPSLRSRFAVENGRLRAAGTAASAWSQPVTIALPRRTAPALLLFEQALGETPVITWRPAEGSAPALGEDGGAAGQGVGRAEGVIPGRVTAATVDDLDTNSAPEVFACTADGRLHALPLRTAPP